ncbi:MAG: Eco57I restriction-modification methylase domain-containing protein [Prevotella sp.]
MNRREFNQYIAECSFREMFIEMGWNKFRGQAEIIPMDIDGTTFNMTSIAERNGFQIITCPIRTIPTTSTCRKIDSKLRRSANDYICIFYIKGSQHQQWIAPVKTVEKREIVTIEYETADKADFLFSKIADLSFELDEQTTIVDVKARIQGSFAVNSEKVTKDFYAGFKKEHKAFADFISGIDDHVETKNNYNKQWYTSVMLNRLMFCYFIQKKGFLDGDFDYLQNKLKWVRERQGKGQFFTFYRGFLSQLFHDGLNAPIHDMKFEEKYGRIPYLNGGMFDLHQLERDYKDIDIEDEAFERLFDFFDKWRWHLDTRITASGKDINPDVLGYIFEQYINDRAQMGAYYTKEDITEYIGRNCIVPFLMDKVKETTPKAFRADGFVWKYLRESGDNYIFDAVKKGYSCDWQQRIPSNIATGIDTSKPKLLERRKDWNTKTDEAFALPTEIWRETVERLKRCETILGKIKSGEITEINDFITYNLDIREFVKDLIDNADDHLFILHFYKALQRVTILDPTCGSGAFLFAAMNILEPLYEACICRMQEFNEKNPLLFKAELDEISNKYRSNIQYFIFKSIILRNLYGVDIMVEATEIAKLRLFLKMVAVVEVDERADNMGLDPLPDIDFNIRCGNTLVGYATEKELENDLTFGDLFARQEFEEKVNSQMNIVATAFNRFKEVQFTQAEDMAAFKKAKNDLKQRLDLLNELLNRHMFTKIAYSSNYEDWLKSHQPFHWLAEFYQIIHENGGFDVIIGNPPYVEYNRKDRKTGIAVSDIYKINNYETTDCGNLYAFVIERSKSIGNQKHKDGFIVPSSSVCTPRMAILSQLLQRNGIVWSSLWDERPSTLFDGVCIQLSIHIFGTSDKHIMHMTHMNHWTAESRCVIFKDICFTDCLNDLTIAQVSPKINTILEIGMLDKMYQKSKTLSSIISSNEINGTVYYKNAGGRYWRLVKSYPTYYSSEKSNSTSTEKKLFVPVRFVPLVVCALSSSLFYWYWRVISNCRHLTSRELDSFPFKTNMLEGSGVFDKYLSKFEKSLEDNKDRTVTNNKSNGVITQDFYYVRFSKPIIDEIDKVLAKHYGFTEEELDFIINYDIKYRMGDELNSEESE